MYTAERDVMMQGDPKATSLPELGLSAVTNFQAGEAWREAKADGHGRWLGWRRESMEVRN